MLTMMGSNKVGRTKSCSFGKPKTPRLGISGIDYVNGLANHGYNHFHLNGGAISGGSGKPESNGCPPPAPQLLQSMEVVQQFHHQQQTLLHHHLDAINKANSLDSRVISSPGAAGGGSTTAAAVAAAAAGCKLKRKKLQPFEPTYYFDSDFDSEDGGNGGRRRSSTLNCSPSIVSRFLRLSRRKSSTSSSSSKSSKRQTKQQQEDQQPLTAQDNLKEELQQPLQKIGDASQQQHQPQSKRLSEDQQHSYLSGCGVGGGFRGGLGSNNNNNRVYPQEEIPAATSAEGHRQHHYHLVQSDVDGENTMILTTTTTSTTAASIPAAVYNSATHSSSSSSSAADEIISSANNGKGLLSPLRERLAAIEELTTSLQSWQTTEKTEYEKCVSDLANQVSRAVALQQLMKSEVEKLQQRVVDLENHNKAMATMIIPTLMKLHDTVGIKEGPQLKSIEPAPNPDEDGGDYSTVKTMTTSDIQESESRGNLRKSQEMLKQSQFPSHDSLDDHNDYPSRSYINNTCPSTAGSSINNSPSHFIAVVSTSSTSPSSAAVAAGYYSSQNASSPMKTISYERDNPSSPSTINPHTSSVVGESTAAAAINIREKITRTASSDLQPLSSSAHTNPAMTCSTPVTSLRSPVKAPRTSRAAAIAASTITSQIPKMNGSSSGNIAPGSNSSSLSRSNSLSSRYNQQLPHNSNQPHQSPTGAISLIENEPSSSSLKCEGHHQNQSHQLIQPASNLATASLESSITSSTYSTCSATGPIQLEMSTSCSNDPSQTNSSNNNSNSVPRSSCRTSTKSNNSNSQSNNPNSNNSRTSLSGIPRMSSPARTATVTKIPCGQQPPSSSTCPTPKPARRVSDRSSSPHGSKLPVRKTSFISSTSSSSAATTNPPVSAAAAAVNSTGSSRHPAASSKSLPANSNMGTAFQNMSKSGPQGNKHSKSTFGFGLRKSSASNNSNTSRNAGGGGVGSKTGNKTNSPSSVVTNLPESGSGSNSATAAAITSNAETGPTKPIKLSAVGSGASAMVVPPAIGITKASGNGKDEGYSTMSSEALAEQEHHHHLRHNNSLEKSTSQRAGVGLSRNSTFSVKSGSSSRNSRNASMTTPSSSSATGNKTVIGSGSCTNTVPGGACTTENSSVVTEPGTNRNSIHKSNTFNTFREIPHRHVPSSSCDVDADADDDEEGTLYGVEGGSRRRVHISKNYPPAGPQRHRVSHDMMVSNDSSCPYPRNSSQVSNSSGQYTSLPTSSSSASSSPSKGKLNGCGGGESSTSSGVASTTSSKRPVKSSYRKDRITATTRMLDGNIVRIVRGSPYSVRLYGDDSGDDMEDEEDPSSSTILWEDSDDSDILFLPLEVSASSATSSRSTLVPPPQSSGESRSYYSSWGTGSSSMGTSNTYCSTLEKGSGSNTSVNNSTISGGGGGGGAGCGASSNSNTYSKRAYPLRRTKGEVTVDVLISHNAPASAPADGDGSSFCDDPDGEGGSVLVGEISTNKISSSGSTSNGCFANRIIVNGGDGGGIHDVDDMGHLQLVNNHINNHTHDNPTTDEMEERALIEKWMQLEEVRNEQVQGGEQWAWDWDGVERTYTRVLRNARSALKRVPLGFHPEMEDEDDDLDVDLILEESVLPPPTAVGEMEGLMSIEERNNAMNERGTHRRQDSPCQTQQHQEFDSSTWTKSKSRSGSNKKTEGNKEGSGKRDEAAAGTQGNNSQDIPSPEKARFREGGGIGFEAEAEHQILLVLEGERDIENEAGLLIKKGKDAGDEQSCCDDIIEDGGVGDKDGVSVPRKSHNRVINLNENGMVVRSSSPPAVGDCGGGGDADGEDEDDPPPVIEFTPEFYRLANYGSNLSFSDNESGNVTSPSHSSAIANGTVVAQSPKVMTCSTGGGSNNKLTNGGINNSTAKDTPAVRNSPKKRKPARRFTPNNSAIPVVTCSAAPAAPVNLSHQPKTPTDDKISQTDFSCSSLENISSVSSSELSAECRNCLEIIKKLVGQADTDDTEDGEGCSSGDFCASVAESEENGALYDHGDNDRGRRRQQIGEKQLVKCDSGSYATTWISVPKGLPIAEVDRILEILSSSESEGVLSPSK